VKKQLYRETSFANQDFLTKISNSRAFYNYASMEMARLKRYKAPFTLVYFDVDNFKSVNDNYGHNEGDTLLLEIARVIRKHIRPTDVVARLGGDEFAVLLLETNARQAHLTICKLQKILKNSAKIKERKITFSFGVVVFIKSPKSVDDMIKKADEMMYISKHAGKDTANYFVYRH
jgi:diguanylate cyclase (GGDEF)-like protein